jgi:hypothetical protein
MCNQQFGLNLVALCVMYRCQICGRAVAADNIATSVPVTAEPVLASAVLPNLEPASVVSISSDVSTKGANTGDDDLIKITVKGKLSNSARFDTRLEESILSKGKIMTPLLAHCKVSTWSRQCDNALLEYLNNKAHRKSGEQLSLSEPFAITREYLSYQGQCLSNMTLLDISMRTHLIFAFNKALESLLSLVDLSNDDPNSLGAMIRRSNRYMLSKVKQPLLDAAMASTAAASGADIPASVVLDNFKALNSRDHKLIDPATSQNTFVQCFRQLHHKSSALFRYIISGDRVFQISFNNESGIDAGGVFREGVSRMMEDLFSEHFSLLIQSPNGQQAVHSGMDKYVPNPKHTGPLALEMFEFIGKLMAMSVRAKLCLPFEFPPLVWKKIVGEEVAALDLMEVDMIAAKQLDAMEHCDEDSVDGEAILDDFAFQDKFSVNGKLKFVYVGSDQVERELVPGGVDKEVTFYNRLEYCQAVREARLAEFDLHAAAMAKGMAQVVPMRALLLFSASQVEELVCGSPTIDIELWKAFTESSGLSALTVGLFWKVMETLTPKEQSGFVRFAWGRSRLPARKEDFDVKRKLTGAGRAALPVSHTCFFSIEMPEYRTEEEMRHGLLTVIHFGVGGILNG